MAALLSMAGAASGAAAGSRVEARGSFSFEPNQRILDTLHWANGIENVTSGARLTIASNDQLEGEPHVFTIVRAREKPDTIDELFAGSTCRTCLQALGAHDPNGDGRPPFVMVVNREQRGIDAVGDSFVVADLASVRARVSAEAGSTLHFICSIHNEMQGVLHVR